MAHYVTNPDFQAALVERKTQLKTNPDLRISEYIGECILKICSNLAHKNNFNGYSYKEEMVSDAIENCLAVVDKYDSEKYSNPFAYFTQCAFYAFIRRIHKEKRQQEIKGSIIQDMLDEGLFALNGEDEAGEFDLSFVEAARNSSFFATTKSPKKKKEEVVGLTEFCED